MDTKSTHQNLAEAEVKEAWVKPEANVLSINNGTLGIFGNLFDNEIHAS
jgi:hypothetical protein